MLLMWVTVPKGEKNTLRGRSMHKLKAGRIWFSDSFIKWGWFRMSCDHPAKSFILYRQRFADLAVTLKSGQINQKWCNEWVVKWFELTWLLFIVRIEALERLTLTNRGQKCRPWTCWSMDNETEGQVLLLLTTYKSKTCQSWLLPNSGNKQLRWWNRIIRIEQITHFSFSLQSVLK